MAKISNWTQRANTHFQRCFQAFPSFAAKDLNAEKALVTDTLGLDVDEINEECFF